MTQEIYTKKMEEMINLKNESTKDHFGWMGICEQAYTGCIYSKSKKIFDKDCSIGGDNCLRKYQFKKKEENY